MGITITLTRTCTSKEDVTLPQSRMRINWWVGILLFVALIGAKGDDTAAEDLEATKTDLKTKMAALKRSDMDSDTYEIFKKIEKEFVELRHKVSALEKSQAAAEKKTNGVSSKVSSLSSTVSSVSSKVSSVSSKVSSVSHSGVQVNFS